uniref:SEFIR domain-containing protein n=1 Tax=Cyprinus carpio TaxID=7962 RepID=A0A8C1UA42_CYPCA
MYSSSFTAHVVFLCVLFKCSFSVRESLKVRREWSGAGLKERRLPELRLSTLHLQDMCVRVRLSVQTLLVNETLVIKFSDSETGDSDTLLMQIYSNTIRWSRSSGDQLHTARIQMRELTSHQAFWTVRYDCFPTQPGSTVSVSVHTHSHQLISADHVVEHTVPKASVTVDEHAKRFTVRMETAQRVRMSLCYKPSHAECFQITHLPETDPTLHPSVDLKLPYLVPCICVQVWRSDLRGRRIICPDFTHRRWGLITGTAVTLLAAVTVLVCIMYYLVKRRTSVWRSAERRPVLLVCSSDDAAHIAAVCSLASGLQGELLMDVRLAQWASSLAQLGPVPWLYGQCQAVQKAGGLVLIAWSPDAHQAFLRRAKSDWVAGSQFSETGLYSAAEEEEQKCCDGEWMEKPVESSSIMAPVLDAALCCLWTGLHSDGHARGFGLVCFQGLNNISSSTYIPKQLRCVPKYCLPKDLSSLIHDLADSWDGSGEAQGSGRCWPRLLSKALSFFMSRQLAPRLEAGLPGPGLPKSSRKSVKSKRKTRRQKKRRSKVVSACLSRKKHTAPELLVKS